MLFSLILQLSWTEITLLDIVCFLFTYRLSQTKIIYDLKKKIMYLSQPGILALSL